MPRSLVPVLALAACLCVHARGELTVAEARALAEEQLGVDLSGAEADVDRQKDLAKWVYLTRPARGDDERVHVAVEVLRERIIIYSRSVPKEDRRGRRLSEAEAIERAREYAPLLLTPEELSGMTWEVIHEKQGEYLVKGYGPDIGDPPRRGMTPTCDIRLWAKGGALKSIRILLGSTADLVDPEITSDEALQLVGDKLGERPAEMEILEQPYLYQLRDQLQWRFTVRGELPEDHPARRPGHTTRGYRCVVDAVTGEIISLDPGRSVPGPDPDGAPGGGAGPALAWAAAGAGALLLLGAGIWLVITLNRRS
jgi:hypothetical protein